MGRISVDIAFYLAHRAIHSDLLYKTIHKKHHEHISPRLQTNFHFTPLDLFIEAALPTIVAEVVNHNLFGPSSRFEQELLFFSHGWFEGGSHTGIALRNISNANANVALRERSAVHYLVPPSLAVD